MKPRIEFGSLTRCGTCGRRKVEPGAAKCPDCLAIGRLVRQHGDEIDEMWLAWPQRTLPPSRDLAVDPDYRSFGSRDELMEAYGRRRRD